ncbi:MAG: threonine/serine exporter ThrE family protein [Coriobacteriales bacterium]
MHAREDTLQALLELGAAMLLNGAEVNRVERRLEELGCAYGASAMSAFVITASMLVTMEFPDGTQLTQSRRILGAGVTDYRVIEGLDRLARECTAQPCPPQELQQRVRECQQLPSDRAGFYIGSVLAAAGFAVFFGGEWTEALVAGVFALLVAFIQRKWGGLAPNLIIFNLVCSLIAGLLICAVSQLLPELRVDKVLIGEVMLLIPGIAMTNAIRDMLMGDTIAGVMRFVETLLWAAGLACGFMTALLLTGVTAAVGPGLPATPAGMALQTAMAFVGSLGFAMIFHLRRRWLMAASLGGMLSWMVYLGVTAGLGTGDIFLPTLVASAFAALYAEVCARVLKTPSLLFVIPAVIPLIPGAALYYTMSFAVVADWATCSEYLLRTLWFAAGIAAGMCITWAVEATLRRSHQLRS